MVLLTITVGGSKRLGLPACFINQEPSVSESFVLSTEGTARQCMSENLKAAVFFHPFFGMIVTVEIFQSHLLHDT